MIDLIINRNEIYSFTPNDGSPIVHVWSGQLREYLRQTRMDKTIQLTFPSNQTREELIEQHGLEEPRLKSMTEEQAQDPVIVGLWSDGTHILIDGAHRRAFWAERGVHVLRGWAVPEFIWRAFTFDMKEVMAEGYFLHRDGSLLPQRQHK